jgi:hypothetical protein
MQPWCSRMKQLLEENNVDQPPKPDFTRSLPPLLMDTVDICSPAAENDEKFTVKCRTLLCSATASCTRDALCVPVSLRFAAF